MNCTLLGRKILPALDFIVLKFLVGLQKKPDKQYMVIEG